MADALIALRSSLAEQLASLRGEPPAALPPALLDIVVRRVELPGGDVFSVRPADWEQLRHEEGGAGRPIPYWARVWPSGLALTNSLDADPPPPGARVIELGCGLALPSIVAARAGAAVLATDGLADAVAFAAHGMALNHVAADVAHADWTEHADALEARGPFDVVLASDVLYLRANVAALLRLLPRILAPDAVVRLADPGRAGARDFLAAARTGYSLESRQTGEVTLHTLRRDTSRRRRAGSA